MMPDLSFIHASPFYELTALIVLAAVIGFIGVLLRQPMIVSFIAVGVLAGPSALNIVQSNISNYWRSWESPFCCFWWA